MTRLTDEGLETDEAVVKACFIGKLVARPSLPPDHDDPMRLFRLECVCINETHPLLIPARVVADFVGFIKGTFAFRRRRQLSILLNLLEMQRDYVLFDWLRKHTSTEEW